MADPFDDALADEMRAERESTLSGPDSTEGRELGRVVGENVRSARERHGTPLATVAERSEIRIGLLEALESGQAVPSLRAIWNLATALGVPFGDLLARTSLHDAGDATFRVQRASEGRRILNADGTFRSRVLFPEGDPRSPEVYELTLAPGCEEPARPHAPDTREHITVVSGTLEVRAGERTTSLAAGDALLFRADVPHGYRNPGTEPVVAHLVMAYGERG